MAGAGAGGGEEDADNPRSAPSLVMGATANLCLATTSGELREALLQLTAHASLLRKEAVHGVVQRVRKAREAEWSAEVAAAFGGLLRAIVASERGAGAGVGGGGGGGEEEVCATAGK